MGSRMMHLIIANRIAESLSMEERTELLLGGIAPDAVAPKGPSHYFIGDLENYSREIDYDGFLEKYKSHSDNHYILGYYTHLIADDLWLQGFYQPWLKNRMENNEEVFNLYHNDFRLLNGKLLEYYGFRDELIEALGKEYSMLDLEEVKIRDVEEFITYVLGDMEYGEEVKNEKLNVFTFEQIVGYIETSVDKGVKKIKPILAEYSV
ncbi:hydrolase [Filobacillus milosensis]|uniref:Hydrolase n=1 Tax=Filobacillus milosensis TaxID=94137 RepID=A0A4Y8IUL1_9BACI|nr:zinc dependent phospholipase C family protein [Filobacillus milosensis]TFB23889.1 hydrolase [Filobacillus milosensis]